VLDFGGVLSVALLAFWVYCIVDVALSDAGQVRSLTKMGWLAIVVLVFPAFPIGGALWFGLGRPPRDYSSESRRERFAARSQRPTPRWGRQQPADPTVDEAVIRARIEERDRLLAKWADEEERRKRDQPGPAEPTA
jgi:hypothetical protein